MDSQQLQAYFTKVNERLEKAGYRIFPNINYKNQVFEYVAKKTGYAIERGGLYSAYFILGRFKCPDHATLNDFSTKSFKYADRASFTHPPRGVFYSVFCFPVTIVDSIDANMSEAIRLKDPPRHWCGSEKLWVVSLNQRLFIHSETSPYWGEMYTQFDKEMVENIMSFDPD